MLEFEHFKNSTATICLTDISNAISRLTKNLGMSYDTLVCDSYTNAISGYNLPTIEGSGTFTGVCKHPEIAVAIAKLERNTIIDAHNHKETEIMKVLTGELKITLMDKEHVLVDGDVIIIPEEEGHYTKAVKDSEVLAITLPASIAYPEVE